MDTVVFDKTGTLTTPQAEIQEVIVVDKKYTKADVIGLAALAEGVSGHPVARAARNMADEMHIGPLLAAEQFKVLPGFRGVGIGLMVTGRMLFGDTVAHSCSNNATDPASNHGSGRTCHTASYGCTDCAAGSGSYNCTGIQSRTTGRGHSAGTG